MTNIYDVVQTGEPEYKELKPGEIIRSGDEFLDASGKWRTVMATGYVHQAGHNPKRRKIKVLNLPQRVARLEKLLGLDTNDERHI